MTGAPDALQALAFGDLSTGLWGGVLVAGGGAPFVCLGTPAGVISPRAELTGSGPSQEWHLTGAGVELVAAPFGDPEAAEGLAPDADGFDQLCRVSGRFQQEGELHPVASLGCRALRGDPLDGSGYDSVREVLAWFEPGDGLALAAFRPRKAKGQEADRISAAVLDPASSTSVEDPRLSTTYTAAGWPARASLELWLGGEDDHHLLRRAAGQAAGARAEASSGELEVRAELFHWYSRGQDGAGVFFLASRR